MPIEIESPEQLGYDTIAYNLSESSVADRRLADLDLALDLAESSGAFLLVDETYRDLTHATLLPMAASLSTRAISVSSMSKAYGLPGLRVGWAVSRDAVMAETLLAAKEQMMICGPTLDE